MTYAALQHAIHEAHRFLRLAGAAVERVKADDMARITGSKETAAARRASMDLTRALANLRRPA